MGKTRKSNELDNFEKYRTMATFHKPTFNRAKAALYTTHLDKHKTISGLINAALCEYLGLPEEYQVHTEKTAPKRGGTKE